MALPTGAFCWEERASRSQPARLNIENRHQVARLCSEFTCRSTDVYIAVAMVGDRLREIRAYLRRALSPAATPVAKDLPPLWPSLLHCDEEF
jgi:hypothetical protein